MKLSSKSIRFSHSRGSILVICLILAGLGTIGVAAWISLLDARGQLAEQNIAATDRRIRFRNSEILARHVVQKRHLHRSNALATAEQYILPDDMGDITVGVIDEVPLSTIANSRIDQTGANSVRGFTSDVAVNINNGTFQQPWMFQLKSASPLVYGDLLTIHPSYEEANGQTAERPGITGGVKVNGRTVLWPTNYSATPLSVQSERYLVDQNFQGTIVFQKVNGQNTTPENFPFSRQTTGTSPNGNGMDGYTSIVDDNNNAHNSYRSRIEDINSYVSVDPDYVEVQGNGFYAAGAGPATIAGTANDTILINSINNGTLSDSDLAAQLITSSPLSSNVMTALYNKTNPMSLNEFLAVINANTPLADDALGGINGSAATIGIPAPVLEIINRSSGAYIYTNGAGHIEIDLRHSELLHMILRNFTSMRLRGFDTESDADLLKNSDMTAIVVSNAPNVKLESVDCVGHNSRRVVLAVANRSVLDNAGLVDVQGNAVTAASPRSTFRFLGVEPFSKWRMICEFEGIATNWDSTAVQSVTLTGGIRADHGIHSVGGNLIINKETNLTEMAPFLIRNAWLESYKN